MHFLHFLRNTHTLDILAKLRNPSCKCHQDSYWRSLDIFWTANRPNFIAANRPNFKTRKVLIYNCITYREGIGSTQISNSSTAEFCFKFDLYDVDGTISKGRCSCTCQRAIWSNMILCLHWHCQVIKFALVWTRVIPK